VIEDVDFCSNSYLIYRMIVSDEYCFSKKAVPRLADISFNRDPVSGSDDLFNSLQNCIDYETRGGDAALALSGGIDSAILAKMMPEGSVAYTFRCIVPGVDVIDETPIASKIAKMCGLKHKIVNIFWDDIISSMGALMNNKGAPIHSIECQIYKAGCAARADGFSKFIFGENADIIYGGMDGLLKKDWSLGEFVDRYSYVPPYFVLKKPQMIIDPFLKYYYNGVLDAFAFTNEYFRREALGTYDNACSTAGIEFVGPFSRTKMSIPIDLNRIRSGDSKYLVRELFSKLYNGYNMPDKIPMPRPTNEWLKSWTGPERKEFIPDCAIHLSGDQKWMVFCLESFLNQIN